jgi:anaphase-promoting complex subunit 5
MLEALRARVDEARGAGDAEALAIALIELAEREPIFGHRQAVVRGLLEQAAETVAKLERPALEGRVLLRLAYAKLVDVDLEGTEQLATRARERLADDSLRVLEAGLMLVRAAIRRHDFAEAERMLVDLGSAPEPEISPLAERVGTLMLLAWAELAVEQKDFQTASERLEATDEAASADEAFDELAFTCKQMLAITDLSLGKFTQACAAMREVVKLAKAYEANEDEIEARLGLAGALGEKGEPINLEEAEKHLQIARDRALEADLDSMYMAALVGQAGLLARKGQTRAAIDRCIEIAQVAAKKQDLVRYGAAVALMAQIYEQKGDLASAYRTYAEAHAALREKIGDRAKEIIVPHMTAFADRIGRSKFAEIAEQVNKAAHAWNAFQRDSGKNHG